MKNKLLFFLTVAPFIITLILLPFMDSQISAHYDIYGNVNRIGSKYETLIIPIVIILFSLAFNWLSKKITIQCEKADNETTKNDLKKSLKTIYFSEICVNCIFIIIQGLMLISIFKQ